MQASAADWAEVLRAAIIVLYVDGTIIAVNASQPATRPLKMISLLLQVSVVSHWISVSVLLYVADAKVLRVEFISPLTGVSQLDEPFVCDRVLSVNCILEKLLSHL